jgi:hypothetical protein
MPRGRSPSSQPQNGEKTFGEGRPRPLDGNAKARLWAWACGLLRKSEQDKAEGRHYGKLSAKDLEVLRSLLWKFHNTKTGLCFPSYESLMEAADCARSTVYEGLKALEDAGILDWVHRIKRIWDEGPDLFGRACNRQRVVRTSNGYWFNDPPPPKGVTKPVSSKSDGRTGTKTQDFILSCPRAPEPQTELSEAEAAALSRLGALREAS